MHVLIEIIKDFRIPIILTDGEKKNTIIHAHNVICSGKSNILFFQRLYHLVEIFFVGFCMFLYTRTALVHFHVEFKF